MMDRRAFFATATGLLARPLAAEGPQTGKVYRIGLLGTAPPSSSGALNLWDALLISRLAPLTESPVPPYLVIMYFKQILNEDCGCSSYIVASRASHECALIDSGLDIQPYLDVMEDRGMTLRYIIDTHLHADHVSGNRRLSGETGVPVSLHEAADVLYPFEKLHDRQKLELGPVVLEVLHTPGHRPESVSLLITNPPRSPLPSMVLTGDCLFVGDVGRPDFGGPDAAAQQYDSNRRLLGLEDYVEVFPAHFEGSCGKGMCGRPSSTIGFERRFNPMLLLPTKEAFVRELTGSRPARPLNMEAIVATNRGAAPMSWAMLRHPLAHVPDVTLDQARPKIDGGEWWLLDVREDEEWQRMHIPGAHHIPQSELATRLAEVPSNCVPLVVCHSGVRSHRAAQFLKQTDFPVVYSLAGGTAGWHGAGLPVVSGDTSQTGIRLTEIVGLH